MTMNNIPTKVLVEEIQNRIKMDLRSCEIVCTDCKGTRLVFDEKENNVSHCKTCINGKLYVCEYCGKTNKSLCDCEGSRTIRVDERTGMCKDVIDRKFKESEKIDYKDYNGKFIIRDEGEKLVDRTGLEEWIKSLITKGKEVPKYMWATSRINRIELNLIEAIYSLSEFEHENMVDELDTESELLVEAQKLINKWDELQGEKLNTYIMDFNKAIMIDELVDEIRKNLGSEG